jgi:hypothetical protein
MSWKKAVGGVLLVGALVGGALFAYGSSQPKTWHVERTVTVQARPSDVTPFLDDLEQWAKWAAGDDAASSAMTYTFGEKRKGTGATYTWNGPGTHGTVTLTGSDETGVTYEMAMEDSATPSRGSIRLVPLGDATKVTWTDDGDFSAMGPLGGLMVPMMEGGLGPHFEGALTTLRALAEEAGRSRRDTEQQDLAAKGAAVDPAATPTAVDPAATPNAPDAPAAP